MLEAVQISIVRQGPHKKVEFSDAANKQFQSMLNYYVNTTNRANATNFNRYWDSETKSIKFPLLMEDLINSAKKSRLNRLKGHYFIDGPSQKNPRIFTLSYVSEKGTTRLKTQHFNVGRLVEQIKETGQVNARPIFESLKRAYLIQKYLKIKF